MKLHDYGYWVVETNGYSSEEIGWYKKIPLRNENGTSYFKILYDGDYVSRVTVKTEHLYYIITTPGEMGKNIAPFLDDINTFYVLSKADDLCYQLIKGRFEYADYY